MLITSSMDIFVGESTWRIPRKPLRWRHNGPDGVSNHQPHDVYSVVYTGTDQRKHQISASLAFVRGIHRRPVNSPHKWPVTRKRFPFDDVIMYRKKVWGSWWWRENWNTTPWGCQIRLYCRIKTLTFFRQKTSLMGVWGPWWPHWELLFIKPQRVIPQRMSALL